MQPGAVNVGRVSVAQPLETDCTNLRTQNNAGEHLDHPISSAGRRARIQSFIACTTSSRDDNGPGRYL
jgi:hypothetical protein